MATATTNPTLKETPAEVEHKPYVGSEIELPELTIKAILLGITLAILLGAANAYVGLRVGLTVSASIPAAVISMGVLRFFRNNNILENNIVQTMAASGPALAAGVIFTVPAALIIGRIPGNEAVQILWWQTVLIALVGGTLGVLFTIPLRRAFIVDAKLPFPEGIACAEVLKVGEQKSGEGVKYLTSAILLGAAYNFTQLGMHLWAESLEGARRIGNVPVYFGTVLEPILMAVGYIVGLRVALYLTLGGAIAWFVLIPTFLTVGVPNVLWFLDGSAFLTPFAWPQVGGQDATALSAAFGTWNSKIRLVGGGAMIAGGLYSLYKTRNSLGKAMKDGIAGIRTAGAKDTRQRTERDMNLGFVFIAIGALTIPMFFVFNMFTENVLVAAAATVVMLIAGFFFSSVAGYMAGIVGSSNNPISGVTIVTLIFSSLLLLGFGLAGSAGILAALAIGAVVCCAAAIGGDNLQDLKTGYLVGSTPWKQQTAQITGAIAFALTAGGVVLLLDNAFGIGTGEPGSLLAPQANLMASILMGIFGGALDWGLIALGVLIGLALMVAGLPVMAVAVGMYLPLSTTVPILIGGLLAEGVARYTTSTLKDVPEDERRELTEKVEKNGILFSSGLIAGGALIGIVIAGLIVLDPATVPLYAPLVFGILAAAGFALLADRLGAMRYVLAAASFLGGAAGTYWLISTGAAYTFASEAAWPGFLIFAYVAMLIAYIPVRALLVRKTPPESE